MHVLQVHTRYREPGGEDAVVDAEAELLREGGHTVTVVESENPASPTGAAAALARAPWNSGAARRVEAAARSAGADVVHVHNTWFALSPAALAGARASGRPVVMTLHNYRTTCVNSLLFRDGGPCEQCVGSHPWHGVAHACYRGSRAQSAVAAATISLARRRGTWQRDVDVFLALTPFAEQRFRTAGLPEDRLLVRPHVVPDPGRRWAPPSRSTTVLVVGRLSREKGLPVVVRAVERLPESSPLRLVIVGEGPERAALEDLAGPRTRFVGRQTPGEVRRLLLSARALVFPSLAYETFGLSMVEAMAAGLPVLASDRGGSSWILGEGAGRVVPAGDVDAWARTLAELDDAQFVDRCGAAARRRWEQAFGPAAGLRSLEDAYAVAARSRGPAGRS